MTKEEINKKFDKEYGAWHKECAPFDCWEAFTCYNNKAKQFIHQQIEEVLKEVVKRKQDYQISRVQPLDRGNNNFYKELTIQDIAKDMGYDLST